MKSSRKGKERAAEPVTEETPSPTHQNLDDLSDLQASTSSTQRPRSTSVSDDDIPSPPPPRSARASQRADKSRSSIRGKSSLLPCVDSVSAYSRLAAIQCPVTPAIGRPREQNQSQQASLNEAFPDTRAISNPTRKVGARSLGWRQGVV